MTKLRVLSYNIHKGFSSLNIDSILKQLKSSVDAVSADLVFLQEVAAQGPLEGRFQPDPPPLSPPMILEFNKLAHANWPHYAYGKNAVHAEGHHGNAILSKHPILFSDNIDVSTNPLENRSLLHAAIELEPEGGACHLICLHLGLFENGRKIQLDKLAAHIESEVPADAPLVVAGDFNDWKETASKLLCDKLDLNEAFLRATGTHARTFPCWLPDLMLDRIYFRGLELVSTETFSSGVWSEFSDHAAIYAEFHV